jgi:hypothetical protein
MVRRHIRYSIHIGKFQENSGEEQWKWFENELKNSDAQIHIVTSGVQILPAEKPIQEKWNNFPSSYNKLFDVFLTFSAFSHFKRLLEIAKHLECCFLVVMCIMVKFLE